SGAGPINFATGGTAFTVNVVSFSAGGFTLDAAGTLNFRPTPANVNPVLLNSAGVNEIRSTLTDTAANPLAATVNGGTLTLNNVRSGAAANSLSTGSRFTVSGGGTLDVVLANGDLFNGANTCSSLS